HGANFGSAPAAAAVMGEVGRINDTLTHAPKTIALTHSYNNPIVFAWPVSRDGGDKSVIRITDIQADNFTLYVDEAPNHGSGAHTTEAVSYLVLEAGKWTLPDGSILEAGVISTTATVGQNVANQWHTVYFDELFAANPIVLSQVQTNHDPNWVKTRQQNVIANSFQLAMEEEEAKSSSHGTEIVGWLAIEPGTGSWGSHLYEAAQTPNEVTNSWYSIPFGQSFSSAPRFLATLATYDDPDNAHLRYSRTSLTAAGVQIIVEEDKTADSETTHSAEAVSYLALENSGVLTGFVATRNLQQTVIQYQYDSLYRLTKADYSGGVQASYTYVYDAVGNMTTFTETVGIT
ncbi:MAG: hypothetical protein GY796_20600, partial [Chloroflexi bacterium]|nr:hypothetical protein [Chloroflexota bacterium]